MVSRALPRGIGVHRSPVAEIELSEIQRVTIINGPDPWAVAAKRKQKVQQLLRCAESIFDSEIPNTKTFPRPTPNQIRSFVEQLVDTISLKAASPVKWTNPLPFAAVRSYVDKLGKLLPPAIEHLRTRRSYPRMLAQYEALLAILKEVDNAGGGAPRRQQTGRARKFETRCIILVHGQVTSLLHDAGWKKVNNGSSSKAPLITARVLGELFETECDPEAVRSIFRPKKGRKKKGPQPTH
jgi:hypothetical protein